MKKRLLVNNKLLRESSIKVGDKDYQVRLRRRIVDLRRVADMAKAAADKAEKADNTELAKKLNDRVEEIEKLLDTYNIDTIDPEEVETEDENIVKDDLEKDSTENDDSEDTDKEESEGENKEGIDEKNQDDNSEIEDMDSTDDDNSLDNKEDNNKNNTKKDEPEKEGQDTPDGGDDDFEDGGDTDSEEVDTDDESDDEESDEEDYEQPDKDENSDSEEDDSEENGEEDSKTDLKDTDGDTKDSSDKEESEDDSEEDKDSENEEDEEEDPDSETDKNNKKSKGKKDSDGEEDSNDEENDSDEEETDDSPIKDPFADEEDIPDLNLGGGTQEPRDATLKDIIKQLKGLPAESKRGAIAALQDIINSHKPTTESLTEAVKGIREMTDDEFGDYINSTYDLIDQVEPLQYEDEEELKKKKAKVGQWSTDPKTLKELEAEDNVSLEKDFRKEKAREKENSKYNKSYVGTLEEFKLNFYNAIKHQVEMVTQEYQSYDEINAEYESEDIIMKADSTQTVPEEVIPVIDIYFDVSGSWGPEDIEIGKKAVATVKEFEDAGEIKLNIFYFSNGVGTTFESTRARYGTGTHGWEKILQNIKATEAQNVMIMTDNDIEYIGDAKQGPTCKVDGCVWFLWKNGEASPSCVSHLIGKQGNYQYAFYR